MHAIVLFRDDLVLEIGIVIMDSFLKVSDLVELTGIARGRDHQTRAQLQCAELRRMGIAFRVNARGAPVVTWTTVNGVQAGQTPDKWQPLALRRTA